MIVGDDDRRLDGRLALAIITYLIEIGGMERINKFYMKRPGLILEWADRRKREFFNMQSIMWEMLHESIQDTTEGN